MCTYEINDPKFKTDKIVADWKKHQRRIQNLVKYLRWNFCETCSRVLAVNFFLTKFYLRGLTGFWMHLWGLVLLAITLLLTKFVLYIATFISGVVQHFFLEKILIGGQVVDYQMTYLKMLTMILIVKQTVILLWLNHAWLSKARGINQSETFEVTSKLKPSKIFGKNIKRFRI